MRTSFCFALSFLLWTSCGGERRTVATSPASPRAQAPLPVSASDESERIAELAEREQEAALAVEAAARELEAAGPADPTLAPAFDELEQFATPLDAEAALDPEQPALEAEETALLDELVEEEIPPGATLSERREIRLRNTRSDLPLKLDGQVVGLIKYFTEGRGRATMRATLGRSGAYREMIERVLEEEGVPLELFHLAQAESGFRPKARSYARATGMWQFMAFRGKQYGLRQDRYLEERYDPENATRAAARHLKDLYIEFDDWHLAMAAYNSGPGRVTRAIARGKTRDYWELCRRRLLPRQTRNYVPIIMAMTYIDKNLDLYDIGTVDYAPPRRYDTVEINQEVSLELLADLTGTRASELEQLNPALTRSATPPARYALRVPEGEGESLLAELAEIPADKRLHWRRHAVDPGETLAEIAARWNVNKAELARVNGIEPEAELTADLALNVPTTTKQRTFRRWGGAGGLIDEGTGRYRIASGDTLGSIARRFGVSVAQLRAWNGLPNTFIRAGRYLIVRPDGASGGVRASTSAGPAPDGRYRVRSGDTLGKIAQRHGASVTQLMAWNGLRSTRINVGQTLKVPGASYSSSPSSPAPAGPGRYRIRPGDNLASIARRFGVSVQQLQAWNGLRSTRIRAGDYLRVRPASEASVPSSAPSGGATTYRVRSGDSLAVIARRHGVTIADLKRWNGLRSDRIQIGQTLKIQESVAPVETARVETPAGPPPQPPPARPSAETRYRIRSGDTLGHIAERFGVTASDLRRWNGLRGSRITAGDYLIVRPPNGSRSQPAARKPTAAPETSQRAAAPVPSSGKYRIQPGDTLGHIAERFGVTASDLRRWNGLRGSRITAGDSLIVRPPSASNGRYKIQPGDTLAVIARRFGVSVGELKAWNGLRSTEIRAGSYLTVRSNGAAGGE